jgi:hypothetical protein
MLRFRVKKNQFQLLGANSTSRGTIVPKECHVLLVASPCYLVTAVSERSHCGNTLWKCLCFHVFVRNYTVTERIPNSSNPTIPSFIREFHNRPPKPVETTTFKSSNLSNDGQWCHCPFSS